MFFKRNVELNTIKEVVENNTGLSINQLLNEERDLYVENIKEAVDFVKEFQKNNPDAPIKIIGDYDVDGIFATSIMEEAFRLYNGTQVLTRLPKRFSEGYGLSEKIIDEIQEDKILLITVDNGIKAIKPIKKAKERGFSVIVIDHHLPARMTIDGVTKNILPEADVIVDPHIDKTSVFKDYCGAALAYKFAKELMPDKKLKNLLVLASIATVADVMPLLSENRSIVKDGLDLINKGHGTPGLKELLKTIKLQDYIGETNYGFKIGPTINAPGRLYDNGASRVLALIGARRDDPRISFRAKAIRDINEKRKAIVKEKWESIEDTLDERPVVLYDPTIGEGIIGIIAGKICEKQQCPAIVFTDTDDPNIIKGSGRSIKEKHMENMLTEIQDLIIGYGGHEGAAGLSIKKENLEKFTDAFKKVVGELPPKSDDKYYDLEIGISANLDEVVKELNKYAPYGEGNPKPIYNLVVDLDMESFKTIGDGTHFTILEKQHRLKLLGFGLAQKFDDLWPRRINMIGYITESFYNDERTICFEIIDFEARK